MSSNISDDAFMNEVTKFILESEEKRVFEELKEKSKIVKPVLICSKKIKYLLNVMFPNYFCILATNVCEADKVYMVTDNELADNIRESLKWESEVLKNEQNR